MLWEKDYVTDFNASVPTWGMAGAPLVDGDLLICLVGGEPDGKVIALDKRTGKEVWRALSSNTEPGYNQPIIINAGGARQLILFHPEGFSSLDPATGQGVLGDRAPRADGDRRRHAGAQRTLPVLHLAAWRRAHARAGRAQARRGHAVERSRASRIPA